MEDPYKKLFEVGDIIRPTKIMERIFSESYKTRPPFVVTRSYTSDMDRWILTFKDSADTKWDIGWYHYRFESVFVVYDPSQLGDTDDDI